MRDVLQKHGVKVANISIRHAKADPGTLLAWSRGDTFALVLYYRQGTSEEARAAVGTWTRELIDAALASDGTYYLPYQIHATREQFLAAYPRAPGISPSSSGWTRPASSATSCGTPTTAEATAQRRYWLGGWPLQRWKAWRKLAVSA